MRKILLFLILFVGISSSSFAQKRYAVKKYALSDVLIISKALNFYLKNNVLKIDQPIAGVEEIDENTLAIHFTSGTTDDQYEGNRPGNNFFTVTLSKSNGEWMPVKITGMR